MKKFLAYAFLVFFGAALFTSCKSSGYCPAYGKANVNTTKTV